MQNTALRLSIALSVVTLAGACKPSGSTATTSPPPPPSSSAMTGTAPTSSLIAAQPAGDKSEPAHRTVKPTDTDPAITTPNNNHEVYLAHGKHNGKLLVFLPGTGGVPSNVTLFLETAARAGYMAIGLDYPDHEAASICGADLACYGLMRKEVIEGTDDSPKVDVTPANSIRNRLVKLLKHLQAQTPSENWAQFLAGDDVVYSSIAFAGHSQGGGHAAYIAKSHEVARVIMFSSVCDAGGTPLVAAKWLSEKHVTPIDRYYGFDHTSDKCAPKIAVTWPALGLDQLGPRVPVDGASPPFSNGHELTTSIPEPNGEKAHTAVIANHATPKNSDGTAQYRDVWHYMLTH